MANTCEEAIRESSLLIDEKIKLIHNLNKRLLEIPFEIDKNRHLGETQLALNYHGNANKYLEAIESLEAELSSIPLQIETLNKELEIARNEKSRLSSFDIAGLVRDDDLLIERCRKLCGK